MAAHGNPDSVTSGLILSLDAGDKNSYPGSGTTWFDLCGKNNTTINGATHNSDGYFTFDGADDYCEVISDGSSYFNKQTFSIEFWCYIDPDGNDALWSYDHTNNSGAKYAQHWRAGTVYGNPSFTLGTNKGGTYNATTTQHNAVVYTPSKWTQLVWTMDDGGTTKISTFYQDGSSIDTETNTQWNDINYYAQ